MRNTHASNAESGRRYQYTLGINKQIRDDGWDLECIYECEWNRQKATIPTIEEYLERVLHLPHRHKRVMTREQLIEGVWRGELFGVVTVSLRTPDELCGKLSEFPPIFVNRSVQKTQIGAYMEGLVDRLGCMKKARRCLISTMQAKDLVILTPLLRFYMELGMEIVSISSLIQFLPRKMFDHLPTLVTKFRTEADKNPDQASIAAAWKLIGEFYY